MTAKSMLRDAIWLLNEIISGSEPCEYDWNGGCQSHFYFGLPEGSQCPYEEALTLVQRYKDEYES